MNHFVVKFVFPFRYDSAALNSFDLSVLRRCAHRAHDINVARAHAEIATEANAYFCFRWVGVVAEKFDRRENHSWSAKAALQRMVLLKCELQGMERFVRPDPFDGGDFGAIGLRSEE